MAGEDPCYIAWVKKHQCSACERSPVEVHHSRHQVGAGLRGHDHTAIPLCSSCHRDLHSLSGWFRGCRGDAVREWHSKKSKELLSVYFFEDVF